MDFKTLYFFARMELRIQGNAAVMNIKHYGVAVLGNVERSLIIKSKDDESMKIPNQ